MDLNNSVTYTRSIMTVSMNDGRNYFDKELLINIMKQRNSEAIFLLHNQWNLQYLYDHMGATLLHYSVRYRNTTITKYLVDRGCDVNCLDESGNSPLMLAVKLKHVETIKILLDANANLNARDPYGRCVLESVLGLRALTYPSNVVDLFLDKVVAVYNNDDALIAKKLMEINCHLVKVIRMNRPNVTRIMLQNNCPIECVDENCNTPLHLAVEMMNFENVKLLVEHGACINAIDSNWTTPLFRYDLKCENKDVKLKMLKYLLDKGASLLAQDLFSMTPLAILLCGADRDILEIIMEYDVDLHEKNKLKMCPLHYLVQNYHPGILEVLRGKSLNLNIRNGEGYTPLLLAIQNYDLEKVVFLLENGADPNINCFNGVPPMFLLFINRAEDERNVTPIVEYLLDYGANIDVVNSTNYRSISVFDLALTNELYHRIKPVIASLVIQETIGIPTDPHIKETINSNRTFKYHYDKCQRHVRHLKRYVVRESVSLFKLLFENHDRITLYARSYDFESNFRRLMIRIRNNVDKYILNALNKRVNVAIKIAELKEQSALVIARIANQFGKNICHAIFYDVVDYLNCDDWIHLSQL